MDAFKHSTGACMVHDTCHDIEEAVQNTDVKGPIEHLPYACLA